MLVSVQTEVSHLEVLAGHFSQRIVKKGQIRKVLIRIKC